MTSFTEKRRHPRLPISRPVTLRHGGRLVPAKLQNVSLGGMRIVAEGQEFRSFSTNFPIEIILDLDPSNRDLSFRGRVVRIDDAERCELGIQLTASNSPSYRVLQHYLVKRTQSETQPA